MELENVIYDVEENIARITMNRGDKMNALNHGLWDDLIAAFDQAENDPEVRVVILRGTGRAFCSGCSWSLGICSGSRREPTWKPVWTTSGYPAKRCCRRCLQTHR